MGRPLPGQTSVAGHPVLWVSQLAWDAIPRRLRHLLSCCARQRRVVFVEAVAPTAGPPRMAYDHRAGLVVATPYVPRGLTGDEATALFRGLLDGAVRELGLGGFVLCHDSPRALAACRLKPAATIYYDCPGGPRSPHEGDELLREEALRRADVVFIDGGHDLAGADLGPSTHFLPGGVDAAHFTRARAGGLDPADQREIPHPRLGFYGALDRDVDLDLLVAIADLRTDFHIVLIDHESGPDRPRLPARPNIHELGPKPYAELPAYLAGWDVALLPFSREAAAHGVKPSQTLECLAAGKPVVATPLRDLINPYAIQGLVSIADEPEDFVIAVECELHRADRRRWLQRVDTCLRGSSWDDTWGVMEAVLARLVAQPAVAHP
ncbi:glycosyltransferase [Nannocystis exedens]|nr:glycosyltransferase [Nannocystis exedens]